MRGDEVRALALRAVDDHASWCVLEDYMLGITDHIELWNVQNVIWKLCVRSWGRSWPCVERCRERIDITTMSNVLRAMYSPGAVQRLNYTDSPLLRLLPRSLGFTR